MVFYFLFNKIKEAASPPLHAINRGIGTEGLGTVLAGLWGSGNGTNTFGENVGAIGVTKVCFKNSMNTQNYVFFKFTSKYIV